MQTHDLKILCLTPIKHIVGAWENLQKCGTVEYLPNAGFVDAHSMVISYRPDVLFVNPNQMTYRIDSRLMCGVKIVCTASTGTNHIDVDYCQKNGIDIISLARDYKTIEKISSTAEHAFALTLSLIRMIPSAFDSVKSFQWVSNNYIGRQLNSLTAGVVGYGRLGRMYANYCSAFGMRVIVCDPYKKIEAYENTDLHSLMGQTDIVSLHVHLSSETRHLISRKSLLCSNSSGIYIINTSRGDIVNEGDIIKFLENKRVSGYAADVVSDELGNIANSEIIRRIKDLNIIITPHIGGATREAQQIAYNTVIERLLNC